MGQARNQDHVHIRKGPPSQWLRRGVIGQVCRSGRAALEYLDDRMTKRRLWVDACGNAAFKVTAHAKGDLEGRMGPSDVLPFGAHVLAPAEVKQKKSAQWVDAVFLRPSYDTSIGSVAGIVEKDDKDQGWVIRRIMGTTNVRPVVFTNRGGSAVAVIAARHDG